MYNQFRKAIRTPFTMYWIWTVYAGVSIPTYRLFGKDENRWRKS